MYWNSKLKSVTDELEGIKQIKERIEEQKTELNEEQKLALEQVDMFLEQNNLGNLISPDLAQDTSNHSIEIQKVIDLEKKGTLTEDNFEQFLDEHLKFCGSIANFLKSSKSWRMVGVFNNIQRESGSDFFNNNFNTPDGIRFYTGYELYRKDRYFSPLEFGGWTTHHGSKIFVANLHHFDVLFESGRVICSLWKYSPNLTMTVYRKLSIDDRPEKIISLEKELKGCKKAELELICAKENLSQTGNKSNLIDRILNKELESTTLIHRMDFKLLNHYQKLGLV